MSLARHFFREFRPLFRMLEEPLTRSPSFYGLPSRSLFDDPFFQQGFTRPAVDVTEEGNTYIVEADLPGVKKENIEVRIGDGGRSLTIEGKVTRRTGGAAESQPTSPAPSDAANATADSASTAVSQPEPGNQLTAERAFTSNSTFTRTVWLPRPVDTNDVAAKLSDGILTVRVQKAEDKASVSIPID